MYPTTDEERQLRFDRVKPLHTGLHIAPEHEGTHHYRRWWFASEDAVERHEVRIRRLFCHDCATASRHGKSYMPMLVEYQRDPLGAVEALVTTHCAECGAGEMYPVVKLTWDVGNQTVMVELHPVQYSLHGAAGQSASSYAQKMAQMQIQQHNQQIQHNQQMQIQQHNQQIQGGLGLYGGAATATVTTIPAAAPWLNPIP